jgi:hypothetical protein
MLCAYNLKHVLIIQSLGFKIDLYFFRNLFIFINRNLDFKEVRVEVYDMNKTRKNVLKTITQLRV